MAKQPSLRSSANDLGRVAQSAERVREQHETMVRNHSPAATSLEDRLVPRLNVIERMSVADHPQPRFGGAATIISLSGDRKAHG
jgi:hypothetical protein